MTNPRPDNAAPNESQSPPPKTPPRPLWERASLAVQLALSLAVAGGVLAYLLYGGRNASDPDEAKRTPGSEDVVHVAGPKLIHVRPGTVLDNELQAGRVRAAWLTSPILPVTGAVLASLRPARTNRRTRGSLPPRNCSRPSPTGRKR